MKDISEYRKAFLKRRCDTFVDKERFCSKCHHMISSSNEECGRKPSHVLFINLPDIGDYPGVVCEEHAREERESSATWELMPVETFLEKLRILEPFEGETVEEAIAREIDPGLSQCYCLDCREKIYKDSRDEDYDEDYYPAYCEKCVVNHDANYDQAEKRA